MISATSVPFSYVRLACASSPAREQETGECPASRNTLSANTRMCGLSLETQMLAESSLASLEFTLRFQSSELPVPKFAQPVTNRRTAAATKMKTPPILFAPMKSSQGLRSLFEGGLIACFQSVFKVHLLNHGQFRLSGTSPNHCTIAVTSIIYHLWLLVNSQQILTRCVL